MPFVQGGEEEEEEEEAPYEEIKSITVRRHKLEDWVNEPFFEATLPGCMVGGVCVGAHTLSPRTLWLPLYCIP